jgi:hypothetical protein
MDYSESIYNKLIIKFMVCKLLLDREGSVKSKEIINLRIKQQ